MTQSLLRQARVVELFAGVGGFRIGLERSGWQVVWANQWEPTTAAQHAFDCYVKRFDTGEHVCADIHEVMNEAEAGRREIPAHELLVGGFPCQDYSVAKTLNQAVGIVGKKGVLWWEIHRLLTMKRPPYLFLENVDRLLKSPTSQRGRDFGVMLATLANLGYEVEWRVVNAADYGFPQKRRRVLIVGRLAGERAARPQRGPLRGHPRRAPCPCEAGPTLSTSETFRIDGDPAEVSGVVRGDSRVCRRSATPATCPIDGSGRSTWSRRGRAPSQTLGDILEPAV